MLHKGRFDNLFFVDLPNEHEREAIWAIQIRKYARKPEKFNLKRLAEASAGMTGSEIQQAFVEALYGGFAEAMPLAPAVVPPNIEAMRCGACASGKPKPIGSLRDGPPKMGLRP